MAKPLTVVGFLGTTLDRGKAAGRWDSWRPTVALCQHEDLLVDRLVLLHGRGDLSLAKIVRDDIAQSSPETKVTLEELRFENPWDFEEVYAGLFELAKRTPWDVEKNAYLIHLTTGTHVAQICLFLLAESRHIPARLLQTAPPRAPGSGPGTYTIIDLDLTKYDKLASRFRGEQRDAVSFLKAGIATRNPVFNALIDRIEQVAVSSKAPILLTGPTGAGKSQLARRIYELKKQRRQVQGALVDVNCATLRGDGAMSTLFGHVRGAFTGAQRDRSGVLREADGGLLFLDEIGELGLDEQAMLLRAIEEKRFLPVGSDREVHSDFQLIAGTNRDLAQRVHEGAFREDLLRRIDLWTFRMPGLRHRLEDLEPNLDFELERASETIGVRVTLSGEARRRFSSFATQPTSAWSGNFRDLNAAVLRMATLAGGGRIDLPAVEEEIVRLQRSWAPPASGPEGGSVLDALLGMTKARGLDPFDRVQLAEVVRVCRGAATLSEAGRQLFAASRLQKRSANDADRLRKYLARFELEWQVVHAVTGA